MQTAEIAEFDENTLDVDAVESLQDELLLLLEDEHEYTRLNKLEYFDPYPFQVEFLNSHASEIALRAANQIGKCNSIGSVIETDKGHKRMADIWGRECTVIDENGDPQKVLNWVKKPKEECFRFVMSDGSYFECPKGHRLLTGVGYAPISQILPSLPKSVYRDSRYQKGGLLNGLHCMRKHLDSLGDYLLSFRLCDAPLLSDQDNVQVFAPLQGDAPKHTQILSYLDDLAYKYKRTLSPFLYRLANLGGALLTSAQSVSRLFPSFAFGGLSLIGRSQNARLFSITEYHQQPSCKLHRHQSLDSSLYLPVLVGANKIISVYSVGFKDLYDMEVENTHSYRACGIIHHNTLSGTAWDAMDLTGRYPDWYTGVKYDRPVTVVVGCVNNDKTRDILQKELFGDPIEWEEELGSGWIPLDCIGKIQKKRGVPDAFYNVRIKHYTDGVFDGYSKVVFLAYEMGKATWMAHKADITHLDEECPMDILEQAARSGIATGGRIRMTFTPENGVTDVVKLVENDYELHTAEWADVAGTTFTYHTKDGKEYPFEKVKTLINENPGHLTEDKIRAAAKKIPAHSLDMRMRGIPVLGSGLVFRFSEEEFKREAYDFPEHFKFLDAIDFGGISSTAHPTAFVRGAYDPSLDRIIIYDGFKLQGKEIPEIAAHINMKPNTDIVPVIYPHDGNKLTTADETTRNQYESAGVNMFYNEENPEKSHATNPPRENQKEGDGGNKIMPGINEMSLRMNDGRFIVFDTVLEFWEEYRKYHMKDGKIVDIDDDFMAAVRYVVMMIRHAVTLEQEKITFNANSGGESSNGWMSS